LKKASSVLAAELSAIGTISAAKWLDPSRVPALARCVQDGSRVGFAGRFGVMVWELLAGEGDLRRLADGRKLLK
jgi:hypothetical protein